MGLYTISDLALAIAAPLMTVFMHFVAIVMVKGVIGFQRINPFNSHKSKYRKYVILFTWAFGICAFFHFILTGVFQTSELDNSRYFMIVASVFPLGASAGSAQEWNKYLASN